MKKYLMALDQGTTSSRCIIFDDKGRALVSAAKEFTQHFPHEGWVEHDAEEIWESQLSSAKAAFEKSGLSPALIAGIGITNQRETAIVWEKESGKPICPAIVWQCRRTAAICEKLVADGYAEMIRAKTGLAIDPYFSATKLQWILDHTEGARERAKKGELLFGTVDSFLIYRLTGGRVHATDPSNAARTMLYNIHTMEWDKDLLSLFDIPAEMLPKVLPSSGVFGETDPTLFGKPIPIAGVAGDQQAALFGQCCFEAGTVKNTYGTGGFLLMNTGENAISSQNGLLTTVGWQIGDSVAYVLEGSVFVCGAAIQWLRDGLGLLASAAESEAIANTVKDTGGVYFVPALTGLGTPYWDPYARGTIVGLSRGTTRAHLVRATLEAMAWQTVDLLEAMKRDAALPIPALRVDGGASANNLLLQLQSDFSALPILRPACIETTALGAANLAGLAVGVFKDLDDICRNIAVERTFTPALSENDRQHRLTDWHRAVERALKWVID
ncbi:MAG: glycerol kinase GlpK [Ruminococcaceae bacterium]|nr:glycerol kinase GlpK [Oscillospiraceae bacterium]